MEKERRDDDRSPNQLRPLACSRSVLHRAHGSATWAQGETKVLAAVYGPKAGTKKNENPEKASVEVTWKPNTGQIGQVEKEYEMILKRTLESICIRTINPNTTTSVIVQVVHDDGALLPCAINAACAALVDAGIPLNHLAVAICCSVTDDNCIILDPTKHEEEKAKAFAYLVFPNTTVSVLPEKPLEVGSEPMANGIITSVTQGAMSAMDEESGRSTRIMNFVSEDQLLESKRTRGERVEDGTAHRDRPLFEILKENKDKKDAEFNERFKNRPPKALDEDETEFLENYETSRKEYERMVADEEAQQIRSFQAAIAAQSIVVHEVKDKSPTHVVQEEKPAGKKNPASLPLGMIIKVKPQAKKAKIDERNTEEVLKAVSTPVNNKSKSSEPEKSLNGEAEKSHEVAQIGLVSYSDESDDD